MSFSSHGLWTMAFLLLCCSGLAAEVTPPNPVGLWWVSHGDGEPLQFRLYADGSAWSDYPDNNPGQWKSEGSAVICQWADDWKEVLSWSEQGWQKHGYAPGQSLESSPSNFSRAFQISPRPDGWFGVKPR